MAKRKKQFERRQTVVEVKAECPKCGCAKRRVLDTKRMPDTPLLHEGTLYPGRIRRIVKCGDPDCAQNYIINEPLNDVTRRVMPTETQR